MWDWIAKIDDPGELEELVTEARESLANPFTTRWGREHMEYQLSDAKRRLSELARCELVDERVER